ncbi:hypothetical protein [Spirochaeta lutea]|nr:hypothetical protein [Spirochaeta lutea]
MKKIIRISALLGLGLMLVVTGCSLVESPGGSGDLVLSLPDSPAGAVSRATEPDYTKAVVLLVRGSSYLSLNESTRYQNTTRTAARKEYAKGAEVALKGLPVGTYGLIVSLVNAEGATVGYDRVSFTIRAGEVTTATAALYRQKVQIVAAGKNTAFVSGVEIQGTEYWVSEDGVLWVDGAPASAQPSFANSDATLSGIVRGYTWESGEWVPEAWLLVDNLGIVPLRNGEYLYSFSENLESTDDVQSIESAEVVLFDTRNLNDAGLSEDREPFEDTMVVAVLQGSKTLAITYLMEGEATPGSWIGFGEILGATEGLEDILGSTNLIKSGIISESYVAVSTPLNDFFFTYEDIAENLDTFESLGGEGESFDVGSILANFSGYGFFNGTALAGRQVGDMIQTGTGSSERLYVFVPASNTAKSGIYTRLVSASDWTLVSGTEGLRRVRFTKSPQGRVVARNAEGDLLRSVIQLDGTGLKTQVPFYAGLPDVAAGVFWDGEVLAILGAKGVRRVSFQ